MVHVHDLRIDLPGLIRGIEGGYIEVVQHPVAGDVPGDGGLRIHGTGGECCGVVGHAVGIRPRRRSPAGFARDVVEDEGRGGVEESVGIQGGGVAVEVYGGERGAVVESAIDTGNAGRNGYCGKVGTTVEDIITDAGDAVRNGYCSKA